MADKTYVVTGPLATPYLEDGSRIYLYKGAEWPNGLRDGETKRFVELDLIGEAETPTQSANPGGEPPRAGRGSGVEAWAEYAASQGISVPEDATRDDIVALVDASK